MVLDIKSFVNLTVPQYLLFYIFGTTSAFLIINKSIQNIAQLLPIILSLSLAILGLNSINMVFDRELDKINKPLRPIPSGMVSVREAWAVGSILCLVSLFLGFATDLLFLLILVGFMLLFLLYSHPTTHLKRYFWSSTLNGAIFYGFVPFLSAWVVSGRSLPLIFLLFFVGLVACVASIKDLEDMIGERQYEISSIPLIIGIKNTQYGIIFGMFLLTISIFSLSFIKSINPMYSYPSLFSCIMIFFLFRRYTNINKELDEVITQAPFVSITMLVVVIILLSYGITSILIG
jgi:geranylgeranylglycerol-phosphate geranylgeranyltransferase